MLKVNVVWKHDQISRVELALDGRFALESCQQKKACQLWLDSYLHGKEEPFPFELDLSRFSPFTQKVLLALPKIPFGQTMSYGELASAIGHPGASRAVGSACSKNPYPLLLPCHRVVAKGGLGGFSLPLEIKKRLLIFESQNI